MTMAAVQVHDDTAFLVPLPEPTFADATSTPEELFRWACFLDQGQPQSVSRERSVDALLAAADDDPAALLGARHYALRALGLGVGARTVVDLLQEALDRSS
jgi:hypothetical protein